GPTAIKRRGPQRLRASIRVVIVACVTARYALLHEIPGQARARLRLHGPDTRRFLQGTLTADVDGLESDRAVVAALCTVKGKLVSELVLVPGASHDEVHALVPADQAASLAEHFDRHIIMDQVQVESLGPVGVALLWESDGTDPAPPDPTTGVESWLTRHPAPGRLCVAEPDALARALANHTTVEARVDAAGFGVRRVATASPAWGHELREGFFPPEVGFVYAVSYDKGCFLGQEPLARIHARGQVNRVMVRVRADRAPAAEVDLADDERPDAGRWTSWAPMSTGGVEGLAIVRRTAAVPGQLLRATEGDASLEVEVLSGPLGDDPGVGRARAATVKLGGRGPRPKPKRSAVFARGRRPPKVVTVGVPCGGLKPRSA
ncbi:MAG: hypothetical protein KDK70_36835, partial [Myxococcales bacterium]|nr:hypothetical protein [Myxococcales bacterium]